MTIAISGCLGTPEADAGEANAAALNPLLTSGPSNVTSTACYGYNAFVFADAAAVAPLIPSNWSLSGPAPNGALALIRILAVGCENEWRVILSTPVVPDAASLVHHDNPDHILAAYTNTEAMIPLWAGLGVDAALADIDWQESPPTHDQIVVTTEGGLALDLTMFDPREPVGGTYSWEATYSTGLVEIGWFHGLEQAPTRRAEPGPLTFGPASPFAAIQTTPWAGQAWLGFDVVYAPGAAA